MAELWQTYLETVHRETNYRATWVPGLQLAVGDVGIIEDGEFLKRTTLAELGIAFEIDDDPQPSSVTTFSSRGVRSVTTKLAGETNESFEFVATAKAGFRVEFSAGHAVVMKTVNARVNSVRAIAALQEALLGAVVETYRDDAWHPPIWQRDWVVVVQVVDTDGGTVLASTESGAAIEVEAAGTIGPDGIADLDAGFSVKHSRSVGVEVVATAGLTPVYKALRVKPAWHWLWDEVAPAGKVPPGPGDEVFDDLD